MQMWCKLELTYDFKIDSHISRGRRSEVYPAPVLPCVFPHQPLEEQARSGREHRHIGPRPQLISIGPMVTVIYSGSPGVTYWLQAVHSFFAVSPRHILVTSSSFFFHSSPCHILVTRSSFFCAVSWSHILVTSSSFFFTVSWNHILVTSSLFFFAVFPRHILVISSLLFFAVFPRHILVISSSFFSRSSSTSHIGYKQLGRRTSCVRSDWSIPRRSRHHPLMSGYRRWVRFCRCHDTGIYHT